MTALSKAALSVLDKCAAEWQKAKNDRTRDELVSKQYKQGLPDGYWKEEWAARNRFIAAKAIYDAIQDVQ